MADAFPDRVRILIVEDDVAHAAAVQRAFETWAHPVEILVVDTLSACRHVFAQSSPDIAVMDLNLTDGHATDMLVSPAESGPCPIVIMTSYGNEPIAVRAIKAGALDYVVKSPESFASMPRTVEHALREWTALRERAAAEAEVVRLYADLEERVKDRTAQLEATGDALLASNDKLACAIEGLESANAELARASARVEEGDQAKSRFLASMSHELRTPLNSIIGFTGVLLQGLAGELTDEQRLQLNMVNGAGKHLLSLINDILDLSRIEAGESDLTIEDLDLEGVVDQAVETMRPLADAKGLALTTQIDPDCGSVRADSRSIQQILLNLIGNAVKFTETGGVTLRVACPGREVCFEVRDTGMGIEPANLTAVFDKFRQLERLGVPNPEGTGLGLPLSLLLAQAMKGRIDLESVPGVGSAFTLVLPAQAGDCATVR